LTFSNWLRWNICGVIPLNCRGSWSTWTSVVTPFHRGSLVHATDSLMRWSFQKLLTNLNANLKLIC
uniref:Ovule protein n=1 Tax=Schistocephalus solidus TaxID=70667 RepID=A0A183TG98_SCHSO